MQKLLSKASDFFLDKESDDFATWRKTLEKKKDLKKAINLHKVKLYLTFQFTKTNIRPLKHCLQYQSPI